MTEPVPKKPFYFRVGDKLIGVRPDPEKPGHSLLLVHGELYRADFRLQREVQMTDWIEEGWQVFMEEVLKKNWPDHPGVRTLCETAFFGGANWATAVMGEEGIKQEVYDQIRAELSGHAERLRKRVEKEFP